MCARVSVRTRVLVRVRVRVHVRRPARLDGDGQPAAVGLSQLSPVHLRDAATPNRRLVHPKLGAPATRNMNQMNSYLKCLDEL